MIKFRKKYILPIKWTRKINKEISEFQYPKPTDVYGKMQELNDEYLQAEKEEDSKALAVAKGKIKLLKWFIGK